MKAGDPRQIGLLIGVSATTLAVAAFLLGALAPIDNFNLDTHFRHFNRIQADPRIVLIDIDDSTLAASPNWPWPRRVFAELVRTLHELGAEAIVLDIVFDQPSNPRTEHAGLGRQHELETTVEMGDRAFDEVIYDDKELCYAIVEAGNVYLAAAGDIGPPAASPPYAETPNTSPPSPKPDPIVAQDPCDILRLAKIPPSLDGETPFENAQLRAQRRRFAKRVLFSGLSEAGLDLERRLPTGRELVPPLEGLTAAAKGVGLVSYHRESASSVVYKLPLVVSAERLLLPQLGIVVGLGFLSGSASSIHFDDDQWLFGSVPDRRVAPIDRNGLSLVNWQSSSRGPQPGFMHVGADRLLEIVENRRAILENGKRLAIARAGLVEARFWDTPASYTDYVRLVNQRLELERRAGRGSPPSADGSPSNEQGKEPLGTLEATNAAIGGIENEALVWLKRAWDLWKDTSPQDELEVVERDRVRRLYDRFGEGQHPARITEINAELQKRNQELLAELGPQLRGKICLVGYTATAMADMVPTPVDPAMPGVMVHANVINMFLQNRFASAAPAGGNVALLVLTGLLSTLAAARVSPRSSVIAALLLSGAILGIAALVFYVWTYHLAALATVVSLLFVWTTVTVYRQVTQERARRQLQRALAQYTSPAVAARIVETARSEGLAPRVAQVSCFFSDLAGFTALSERLGAERTRDALNPYLREVSAVIVRHGGMVNKFIGDGIFAFFNAPLLPCSNHAAAACRSALDALGGMRSLAGTPWAVGAGWTLEMRIGLSTGEAFVGDYGSDTKLDYTCIGDTVNLGSRLERANKALGTTILVDDETRRQAGSGLVFRSLGRVEIPGKAAPVTVHELLGMDGQIDAARRAHVAAFEEAVAHFQNGERERCAALLVEYRRAVPGDVAAMRYLRAIEASPAHPSGVISIGPI